MPIMLRAVASAQLLTGSLNTGPGGALANPVTPAQGGTGVNSSGSTGLAYDAAGTWSFIPCTSGLLQGGVPPTCVAASTITAGKATVLETARAVNGVAFDGSAPITVPAASSAGPFAVGSYVEIPEQAAPGTPTNAARFFVDTSNRFSWKGENGFVRTFDGTANLADRVYTLPDATGTIALTSSNVATATALAADPTDCSAGTVALGINAAGTAQCTATPSVTSLQGILGNVTPAAATVTTLTVSTNSTSITYSTAASDVGLDLGLGSTVRRMASDGRLQLDSQNGVVSTTGVHDATTGYRVNALAPSGNVLRGNGTNFVAATLASTDLSDVTALATLTGSQALTNKTYNGGYIALTGANAGVRASAIQLAQADSATSDLTAWGPDNSTNGVFRINTLRANASNALTPFKINTSGQIGINQTTPAFQLDVSGTGRWQSLTAAGATKNSVCIDASTKEIMENASSSCLVSSARFKDGITPLAFATSVDLFRPVTYRFKGDREERIGLIAEEVAAIDPRLVDRDSQGQPHSIRWEEVTTLLLAEVRTVRARLEALERR